MFPPQKKLKYRLLHRTATFIAERGNASNTAAIAEFTSGGIVKGAVVATVDSGSPATALVPKSYVDGKKTYWIHTVFDGAPSLTTGDATPFAMWHVPSAAANFFVEKVTISYADSIAGDDAASFTFKLRKSTGGAAASDLATVVISKTLNGTTHAAQATTVTGAPVALATNDTLFFIWSAQSAGIFRLRKITLAIHGYSTPV